MNADQDILVANCGSWNVLDRERLLNVFEHGSFHSVPLRMVAEREMLAGIQQHQATCSLFSGGPDGQYAELRIWSRFPASDRLPEAKFILR
jgi:hypothetical protein